MNDQSPPKRVTRARAAAKTETGAGIKSTKVTTAASKAKLTRAVSSTKRRTRATDGHDEEEEKEEQEQHHQQETQPEEIIIEPEPKPTRGRPKKAVQVEAMQEAVPVRATRGRPKKLTPESSAPVLEPARSTRGRQKKIQVEEEVVSVEEPVKRPTRARAMPVSQTTVPKKSVKFEEPDKENIMPTVAKDNKIKAADTTTGLRAKPVRKPAVTRTTRGSAKIGTEEAANKVAILSPKKAMQVATAKESMSDDELATSEKTPLRPLQKSPLKPTGNTLGSLRKPEFSTSISVNRVSVPEAQDLKNSIMGSPARRPPPSPFKENLKNSPPKMVFGGSMLQSPFKLSLAAPTATAKSSPFKASLLASPARRPQSPMKISETGSPSRSTSKAPLFAVTPKASTFKISRFATPRTLTKGTSRPGMMLPPALPSNMTDASPLLSGSPEIKSSNPSMSFTGRLSSIVPRDVDVIFEPLVSTEEEQSDVQPAVDIVQEEPEISAEQPDTIVVDEMDIETTTPPASPLSKGIEDLAPVSYEFREANENPFEDSDSEDELASGMPTYSPITTAGFKSLSYQSLPATPGSLAAVCKTPKATDQKLYVQGQNQIGFTPLAKQLSDWMAASPVKSNISEKTSSPSFEDQLQADSAPVGVSPMKSTFFDDEMLIRDELADASEPKSMEPDLMEDFEVVELEEEDLALAHEADEMSLLEPAEIEALISEEFLAQESLQIEEALRVAAEIQREATTQFDDHYDFEATAAEESFNTHEAAPSAASQEYGDENAIPIDPALFSLPIAVSPVIKVSSKFATPKRILSERTFHTVSKVPLKAAAEDTPMRPSPKKRSASISRLPAQRPTNTLSRNNTVISYSPTKSTPRARPAQNLELHTKDASATPSNGDISDWSTLGTPARTPRRDVNTALLKGAVVFVDVHTSEGADASVLFTELLTQMGARCVKSWTWNGSSEDGSKVGITHVVFKDGGKRTLERVREAKGVVSCIGVGWVLDCEREDKWLDESPYSVDTAMVPRGGHKRRKSMEPRALANLNGTLVSSSTSTPGRKSYASMSPSKEFSNLPDTPVTNKSRRRESVQWIHSPSTNSPDGNIETLMLSPVPATPAPETIFAYGEHGLYGDETPGGQTPYFMNSNQLMQQTAPVRKYVDTAEDGTKGVGAGFLSEKKDESVMMRLMAARRKSLQWAPKVGSPLARGSLF